MSQRQPALTERWLSAIFAEYGEETAANWRRVRDPFANPTGYTFTHETPKLVEVASGDGDVAAAAAPLEAILRIRCVQDFSPSRAIAFVYGLRDVVRAELAAEIAKGGLGDDLAALDRRVERIAMLAFDVYVRCREQIFRLRHDELKRSVATLLRRWHGGELPEPASGAVQVSLPPNPDDRR